MTGWARANRYVRGVSAGRKPACRWTRLACERHARDLGDPGFAFRFSAKAANRAIAFVEGLPHVKGEWALPDKNGQARRIALEDWQCFFIGSLFGWVGRHTGLRRFRAGRLFVPRKNAKSTMAAGIGLYMLAADREPGAEVYCGAMSKAQAMEVFRPARQMCLSEPDLQSDLGIEVNAASLVVDDRNARFEPVVGRPRDGASPHCAIVDEYHQHLTADLYQSLRTGMGARRQPLDLIISTAGSNTAGPCREEWLACEKLLAGTVEDETTFALIYTIDEGDDWATEAALKKANPNWGVSINPALILADQKRAMQDAAYQSDFKTKHLNCWVGSASSFYNVEAWERLAAPTLRREQFAGRPCVIACDFAAQSDLTGSLTLIPDGDGHVCFLDTYLPRETVAKPTSRHYQLWERKGLLRVTDGARTDLVEIVADVEKLHRLHEVHALLIDPNRVFGITRIMQDAGLDPRDFITQRGALSKAARHLDDLIKAGKIRHDGNPILAWAIGNVSAKEDRRGQLYVFKDSPDKKIDPAVMLLMALAYVLEKPLAAAAAGVDFTSF
jgi:phage terminase large subunit-like protein